MSVTVEVGSAGLDDVQAFAARVVDELAAAASTALVVLGDRLGRSFTGWWIAVAVLAQTLLARGQSNAAHDLLARNDLLDGPPPLVWSMPSLGAVRAQVLLAAGQVERSVAELHSFDTWLRSLNFPSPGGWWYPGDLVEGLIRLDRRYEAIKVAQRWLTETTAFCSSVVTGQALRAVGLACNDVERLEEAVSQLEHTSAQLAYARALLDFASALRRRGQRTRARPLLRRTLNLATTADARALAAQAHRELLAAGARPRRTAVTGIDALTASERRVAELAAQGRSNPEIASAVSRNVHRVLAGPDDASRRCRPREDARYELRAAPCETPPGSRDHPATFLDTALACCTSHARPSKNTSPPPSTSLAYTPATPYPTCSATAKPERRSAVSTDRQLNPVAAPRRPALKTISVNATYVRVRGPRRVCLRLIG